MNRQLKKEIRERELAEKALHESNEKIEIISEEIKGLRRKLETSLEDALGKMNNNSLLSLNDGAG